MPGSYIIDRDRSVVFTRAWGALTDAEWTAHARALRADRRFHPDFRQVADFRDVAELLVTGSGIRQVVGLNPFERTSRRAIVVGTVVALGMARMYQLAADLDPASLRICRTMEEGFEWIELERSTVWPAGPVDATFRAG